MPGKHWSFRVRHIITNIERARAFVGEMNFAQSCADDKTVYAVVTCFAIIGEAAKLVPPQLRKQHPEIPWNQMIRMRNFLVHEYDRIDLGVVWQTIQQDLPEVLPKLKKLSEETR